tara:strand:- start:2582 stop:3058 length:477 start_codon:yes stop_codon:yes gene_type:complete
MNVKKNKYILDWISKLSEIRPELGNFAVCPYASTANFIILEEKLRKVCPRIGWDVVIYVVEDDHDEDFLYAMVDDYNRTYQKYKFIADHRKSKTKINGVPTSNGKYNLVLCQPRQELTEARKKLAKTDYYNYWDKNYLEEVLEEDYKVVEIHIAPELE